MMRSYTEAFFSGLSAIPNSLKIFILFCIREVHPLIYMVQAGWKACLTSKQCVTLVKIVNLRLLGRDLSQPGKEDYLIFIRLLTLRTP